MTHARPGESNDNFGMATDIGFAGLRWLHANGTVDNNETSWLHHLTAVSAAAAASDTSTGIAASYRRRRHRDAASVARSIRSRGHELGELDGKLTRRFWE